jgi:hypothetical protein
MLAAVDVDIWKEHRCAVKDVPSEAVSIVLAT